MNASTKKIVSELNHQEGVDPLKELLEKALDCAKKIDVIKKGDLAVLENAFELYKKKLKLEMGRSGMKTLECLQGKATLVENKGVPKVDIEGLKAKFGEDVINEFISYNPFSFVKCTLGKNENPSATD